MMDNYKFGEVVIYRSIFKYIDSNMYIILGNNYAIIIDPHEDQECFVLLQNNNISNIIILLTHEHPDHISGISWLKKYFSTKIICQDYCAQALSDERMTRPILISFILEEKDRQNGTHFLDEFNKIYKPFSCKSDITFDNSFEYHYDNHFFCFKHLLGHSKGSCSILFDNFILFTGDSLLKDYPIITRFPGGNKKDYINITKPYFESLNSNFLIMPGHGNKFYLNDVILEGILNVEFR